MGLIGLKWFLFWFPSLWIGDPSNPFHFTGGLFCTLTLPIGGCFNSFLMPHLQDCVICPWIHQFALDDNVLNVNYY